MITQSIHGTMNFYISDIVDHETFITRELVIISDRGDKLRITLFAEMGEEHRLEPRVLQSNEPIFNQA